ncbi:DNAse I-like superfamily protein [Euphorbia peplus]|nr:DNAse I-like superfamily protein [Euphorbia peplus]
MLKILNKRFRRLCSRLRWPIRRRARPKILIKKFGKSNSKPHIEPNCLNASAAVHPNENKFHFYETEKPIRLATFNAALFSMAPAVPKSDNSSNSDSEIDDSRKRVSLGVRTMSQNDRPKGILKQSPLHPSSENNLNTQQSFSKSKLRVSINLPDNEISLLRNKQSESNRSRIQRGKAPMRSQSMNSHSKRNGVEVEIYKSRRSVLEVLRELDADILALQDVKAEEEKGMKPLSDLAAALGMNYVFAESWAPEYGNAILSKWPIKTWKAHKIFDDTDFRNILKATIEVGEKGEVKFYCTDLDHLDEKWRMKQINAIIESNTNDGPHILAGGLNSLDDSDYSLDRWTDIVKYYEEMGKPTPKAEVMRFLKTKHYTDAKDFAGECESVVMIAKGQNVQGTCKYGTRLDYIMSSSNSPYKFVPGSYSVFSSKGTSDHHIVKVDMIKGTKVSQDHASRKRRHSKHNSNKLVKITTSPSNQAIWKLENN